MGGAKVLRTVESITLTSVISRVIDFVCMSMAIPFLFESVSYNGKFYVDGGLLESVPLGPFFGKKSEDVLALQITCECEPSEKVDTLRKFATRIIRAGLRRIDYPETTVLTTTLDLFNFKMSMEDRLKLYFLHPPSNDETEAVRQDDDGGHAPERVREPDATERVDPGGEGVGGEPEGRESRTRGLGVQETREVFRDGGETSSDTKGV